MTMPKRADRITRQIALQAFSESRNRYGHRIDDALQKTSVHCGRLRSRPDAQFVEKCCCVLLHGSLGDMQKLANLFIGVALYDQLQNFMLSHA
jgi:hypothetical protein